MAELRTAGREAARHAKKLVLERPDGLGTERRIAQRRTSEEGQEGLRAFLEKRDPSWASEKLLVANRGEIALRVFRACRELGIATVAVARQDDAGSLHARSADETVRIALVPRRASEHVRAAREAGADAIHPGYGFLAENADFAEAVEAAGLDVGRALARGAAGRRRQARGEAHRARGRRAGRPEGEPEQVGFPLVVKAAAGGGGRGMRVVREPAELDEALAAARREAKAAFGDERVFCERYLERPRHVEIQLLGDSQGTIVALGERECSIQRRHQKVLEEAPSPRSTRSCARR